MTVLSEISDAESSPLVAAEGSPTATTAFSMSYDAEALEAALAAKAARPCASQELTTYGFMAPFGKGGDAPLVHVSGDFLLIAARKEERILPGSVVRDALKDKVDEIEAQQMRKV